MKRGIRRRFDDRAAADKTRIFIDSERPRCRGCGKMNVLPRPAETLIQSTMSNAALEALRHPKSESSGPRSRGFYKTVYRMASAGNFSD
jgi:hypothetical protein